MQEYVHYLAKNEIDQEAECRYRYLTVTADCFIPHDHDFYEIFLTVKGVVTQWINGVTQELPEGSLVFVRPEDVHGFVYETPESYKTIYINLAFSSNTANLMFQYLSGSFPSAELLLCDMPPMVVLSETDKLQLMERIQNLNAVKWQNKQALKLQMRALLADIFVRFFYTQPKQKESSAPLWLSQLLSQMEQQTNFVAGLEHMVALSGKSREHLSRNMKKHYHITPSEYINKLRINYASNLLNNTNIPVLEICFMCGFQSVSYFYKVFKRKYAVSPHEFREKHMK